MYLASEHHVSDELRQANERLLIAGVRYQELADEFHRQLAFIRAVTDSLDEGVCALDKEGRISLSNPAAEKLIGVPAKELLGRDFHGVVHHECGAVCPLLQAIDSNDGCRPFQSYVHNCIDGDRPVSYSVMPIVEDDQTVGMVIAFRDISESKLLKQALEELVEYERAARTTAEAAAQLRTDILGTVTHDLQNPLTVIMGVTQRLLSKVSRRDSRGDSFLMQGLDDIAAAASKMLTIIRELLDVTMLEAGDSLELHWSAVNLIEVTSEVVDRHQGLTKHHLELIGPEQPIIGIWDHLRLERVLVNLVSNAIKFSPEGGSVTIRLWRDVEQDDWAVVEIQDQGIGIPEEDLPQIFTRYYRASNVSGQQSGIGLGLAGSKEIIEKHGGTISLESTLGAGTTVTLRLPMAPSAA